VVAVDELFDKSSSGLVVLTVAVLDSKVPAGTLESTVTTSVNTADRPGARSARVAVTVPLVPGEGVVRLKAGPVLCTREINVIPNGSGSVKTTFCASPGPLLATVTVYIKSPPADTGSGESVLVTLRSPKIVTLAV